jgi:hypothetical protein
MIDRLRHLLFELRRSERGIALPMALMVTVVGMGLAAVPIVASVNSQGGNQHSQGGNEALAAAEAGAEVALHQQGALHVSKGTKQLCIGASAVTKGWCPTEPKPENSAVAVPGSIGLATYTYRVLPCYGTGANSPGCSQLISSIKCTEAPVEIVSTGKALVGGLPVERRVQIDGCAGAQVQPAHSAAEIKQKEEEVKKLQGEVETLEAPAKTKKTEQSKLEEKRKALEELIAKEEAEGKTETETKTGYKEEKVKREVPPPIFSSGQVVGIKSLTMNNGANVYNGGVGTNGPLIMQGSANACTVRVVKGQTKTINNGSDSVPSYCTSGKQIIESEKPANYPEVLLPSNIATQNSDPRLAGADYASGYNRGNISWNESKKELSLNYGELRLEGTLPYYFCRLVLGGGGKLVPGAGKTIRIFFENPNKCPGLNGATQFVFANGAEVTPDSGHGPGFYFVGSAAGEKETSKIELAGGGQATQLVIYGPRTTINANNGINMSGTIIGQTLELAGGAHINEKGVFTPPTTTEFVAPETVEETIKTPTSETVKSELAKHKEEKRKLDEEILRISQEITKIEHEPGIEKKKGELATAQRELGEWQEEVKGGQNAKNDTVFKKSSFNECSATPPKQEEPASGC